MSVGWAEEPQSGLHTSQTVAGTTPTAALVSEGAGRNPAAPTGYLLPVLTGYSEEYMCCLQFSELFLDGQGCPKYMYHQGALQGPQDIWTLRGK